MLNKTCSVTWYPTQVLRLETFHGCTLCCHPQLTRNRKCCWLHHFLTMGNFTIVRHGLMLLWFKDLMNSTEKFQFRDPPFRHSLLVPSSGDFLGNSLLLAPLFPKPTTKKHSSLTAFSLLELFFSYCIVVAVAKGNILNFARRVSAYPNVATLRARTWLAICEFLWL